MMPQVKNFRAQRELALDCGHRIKAGEAFMVNSLFSCPKDGAWLGAVGKASFREAVTRLHSELREAGLNQKPVDGR